MALIRFATCAYQQLVRTTAAASFDSTGDPGSANQVVEQLSGRHVLHVSSDLGLLRLFRGRPKWIPEVGVEVEVGGGGGFWTGAHRFRIGGGDSNPNGMRQICNRLISPTWIDGGGGDSSE